jgi:hypothetical protein
MLPGHHHEENNGAKQEHEISSQWNCNTLCFNQCVVYTQLEWQWVTCWSLGRRVLTGEQRNLWQQHCGAMIHLDLGVQEELWDKAVVEDLWDILAEQLTILGPHHALEHWLYVEHKGCSTSLEFIFGTCVEATWRTWYQIQMCNHYSINRTWKHEIFGAHSRVKT